MMEDGLIGRVYKTTAVVLLVAVTYALSFRFYVVAGGLATGGIVGLAALWSLEWAVSRTIAPGVSRGAKTLAKYSFLKYGLLAAILVLVVLSRSFTFILAFLGGMAMTQAVIFLKAIGAIVAERMKA